MNLARRVANRRKLDYHDVDIPVLDPSSMVNQTHKHFYQIISTSLSGWSIWKCTRCGDRQLG